MALGTDGLALIAYQSGAVGLRTAHCADLSCSSASLATIDAASGAGQYASLATGGDRLGLIAYWSGSASADLKVAHCSNQACSSASLMTLDPVGDVGRNPTIVVGADGRGSILYFDLGNDRLKLASCQDVACTGGSTGTIDNVIPNTTASALTIGTDGLPLVAFHAGPLKVLHCSNQFCASYVRGR